MIIKQLKRKKKKYKSLSFRKTVVELYRSKIESEEKLMDELKISRNFLRASNRWYFKRFIHPLQKRKFMKKDDKQKLKIEQLEKQLAQIQKEKEKLKLEKDALDIMITIAERELKIPIRKKSGPKQFQN